MAERLLRAVALAAQRGVPWATLQISFLTAVATEMSRRFLGQRVDFLYGDTRVRAILEAVYPDVHADRFGTRLALSDVECAGLHFDTLTVSVDALTMTPPPNLEMTALSVALDGRLALGPLIEWVDGRVPDWKLSSGTDGLLEARHAGSRLRFRVEPVGLGDSLDVKLRSVCWRRREVRLPGRLRVNRSFALPALPAGATITEASVDRGGVNLRLSLPAARSVALPVGVMDVLAREPTGFLRGLLRP